MKMYFVPLVMMISLACHADDNSNPFVSPSSLPPASAASSLPRAASPMLDEPLPLSFTENRTMFDLLEVVGRGANFAVLRYPITGAANIGGGGSAQSVSYREFIARNGKNILIGGRSFKVTLPHGGTNVLLVDGKNGKVLWEGEMSAPKVYYANPAIADFQYTPPVSAGTGVGQAIVGAGNGHSAQGAQPGGNMAGIQR